MYSFSFAKEFHEARTWSSDDSNRLKDSVNRGMVGKGGTIGVSSAAEGILSAPTQEDVASSFGSLGLIIRDKFEPNAKL
jgi:hypothetical protein